MHSYAMARLGSQVTMALAEPTEAGLLGLLLGGGGALALAGGVPAARADEVGGGPPVEPAAVAEAPPAPRTTLCDAGCAGKLEGKEMVDLGKGLKFQEVRAGEGEPAPVGYQVLINYVMRVPGGQEFANTVSGEGPQDVRVGTGNLIEGMDLGLVGMKSGEIRRLFVPGELGFEKGLPAAPGRARVLPKSDLVIDLELVYIPGLDY